jgi:hypothetical protein
MGSASVRPMSSGSIPPPGASDFHVKGLVYSGARDFYAHRLPGGLEALRAQLVNPDVIDFWEQTFVASSWYDLYPLMAINQAASRLVGVPYTQLVTENARSIAQRDIRGVYKLLLNVASPEIVVRRLLTASLLYLDFGQSQGEFVGPKVFRAVQLHIPGPFSTWMTATVRGFVPVAMEEAGAHDVQIESYIQGTHAHPSGAAVMELVHDIKWH